MSDEPKKPAIAVALEYEEGTRAAPVGLASMRSNAWLAASVQVGP